MSDPDLDLPRPDDEYTARYMEGGRAVVQTRQRMVWWFFALLGFSAAVQVIAAIAAGTFASLLSLPLLAVVGLLFSHLRVTVTPTHLYIQFGLFGPTIPLANVESASVVKYQAMRFGGWGIRRSLDGTRAYSVPGNEGQAVELRYRDDKGKARAVVVTTARAEEVCRAVMQGAARAKAQGTGVRVEVDAATAAEVEAEVERAMKSDEGERSGR